MPSPLFNPLIEQAIELAAQWHLGTYRKQRWREPAFEVPEEDVLQVPVMAHLAATALTVQRAGWSDPAVAAAFLHDALEDQNRYGERLRRERLRTLMGAQVATLVEHVTEHRYDAQGEVRPWRERKERYLEHLEAEAPDEAVAISLADKLHNLWTMNQSLESGLDLFAPRQGRALSAGPQEQHWFYRAVLEASEGRPDARLTPQRRALEDELQRFERLSA